MPSEALSNSAPQGLARPLRRATSPSQLSEDIAYDQADPAEQVGRIAANGQCGGTGESCQQGQGRQVIRRQRGLEQERGQHVGRMPDQRKQALC